MFCGLTSWAVTCSLCPNTVHAVHYHQSVVKGKGYLSFTASVFKMQLVSRWALIIIIFNILSSVYEPSKKLSTVKFYSRETHIWHMVVQNMIGPRGIYTEYIQSLHPCEPFPSCCVLAPHVQEPKLLVLNCFSYSQEIIQSRSTSRVWVL